MEPKSQIKTTRNGSALPTSASPARTLRLGRFHMGRDRSARSLCYLVDNLQRRYRGKASNLGTRLPRFTFRLWAERRCRDANPLSDIKRS